MRPERARSELRGMVISVLLFWCCILTLAYVYAGYPLLIVLSGWLRNRVVQKGPMQPMVSLIIVAFNEEESIRERLDNALALDYPAPRMEVIVASDGSSDSTASIVERYAEYGVRLLTLPRQGKIHALNQAVLQASGEVLVFSDANTLFDRQALRRLVENLADPQVGGVAGHTGYVMSRGSESTSRGEGLYWSYDTWLKEMESRTGSVVSAHGGIYAIRRELYQRPEDAAVTDDFAISTAVIEQGFRLVFEPRALAYEVAVPEAHREFSRKVRLMTRGWRSVLLRRRLLNPFRHGFYSLVLFSHKVLRRVVPVFLLTVLLSSLLLSVDSQFYLGVFVAQLLFYIAALTGYVLRCHPLGRTSPLCVPFFYCLANAAAAVALVKFVRGERVELWKPQRHTAGLKAKTSEGESWRAA